MTLPLLVLGDASARGQGCPPRYVQDFDVVTPPMLPADWTATQGMNVTGAPLWITSTITPDTPPNAVFSTAPDNILDNRLDAPPISAGFFDNTVTFNHSYDLEEGFDGAVLEISTPTINGGAFTDVTDPAVGGSFGFGDGYNSTISTASQSPIAGRMAWSGNSNGYTSVHLFLGFIGPSFGDNVVMRFRLVTDNSRASAGWRVDTFRWHHNECNPPSPTPTTPPKQTPTPTPSPTPTLTPPPSPTATPSPTPSPTPTPSPPATQALNISTRLRVETGDRIMIGGFIITGSAPKRVALRALGPSLSDSGLTGLLADPTLELRGADGALILQNDNWQDDPFGGQQLASLGLAPHYNIESGMVATLQPGAYTALMAGKNQTSGLGLLEIYDTDPAADSQLANISTRGFVRVGDNVMIGGFILGDGSGNANVVVRGIGPSLGQFGLSNVLADPTLELRDSNGALLIANDNWQDDPLSAAQLTARGFAPPHQLESGIFATLSPGLFTAILAGKNGGVGIGLVEIYRVNSDTLTVTSMADSGAGSLRQAIAAAEDGDTIQFAPALNGQTIFLTTAELLINKSITISGPGPSQLTVGRNVLFDPFFRIIHVTHGHTVTIEGLTITGGNSRMEHGGGVFNEQATLILNNCDVSGNYSNLSAGGIYNFGASARLTILNSRVVGNVASGIGQGGGGQGGGIYSIFGGTLTITNSVVSGNSVSNQPPNPGSAGGIFSDGTAEIENSIISGNVGGARGGGIVNGGSMTVNVGPMTISNCTISGNSTIGSGGGISNAGPLTITNSTISGNSANHKGFGNGGGISTGGPFAVLAITNCTISGNSVGSVQGSGGGIEVSGGTLQIRNTILHASGMGGTIFSNSGTVTSQGYNLSSDNGGGFLTATGDQINTLPMLGPLQNNGGPTATHALLSDSPAINTGAPNFVPPPLYDQRGPGYPRVSGGRIDIGSFELQP